MTLNPRIMQKAIFQAFPRSMSLLCHLEDSKISSLARNHKSHFFQAHYSVCQEHEPLIYVQHAGQASLYLANPMGLSERGVWAELRAGYQGEGWDGEDAAWPPPLSYTW